MKMESMVGYVCEPEYSKEGLILKDSSKEVSSDERKWNWSRLEPSDTGVNIVL